jgi:hypothetical protein
MMNHEIHQKEFGAKRGIVFVLNGSNAAGLEANLVFGNGARELSVE